MVMANRALHVSLVDPWKCLNRERAKGGTRVSIFCTLPEAPQPIARVLEIYLYRKFAPVFFAVLFSLSAIFCQNLPNPVYTVIIVTFSISQYKYSVVTYSNSEKSNSVRPLQCCFTSLKIEK